MKRLSLLLLLGSFAGAAWAQTPPPPPSSPGTPFEQHKAMAIAKVQAHIAREQQLLACLQAAQDRAALRACRLAARPVR
ncbi:MAG TPA: hypothetical protein VF472_12120 [Burkholderiaceae bacterium]